ncbi:MAG: 50S ribosomal protein L18 [Robiginitomaculum sp.]|nr:50S ribosomal protein L18 [Robiginitomaculum sp.]
MKNPRDILARRAMRTRTRLKKLANGRPRLSVFRSNKYIYVQLIDDASGKTLAHASSLEADVAKSAKSTGNVVAAKAVGELIAKRAKKAGVEQVIFDRGAYIFHGRVKALADAARDNGLQF